jgi:hypothetical protein
VEEVVFAQTPEVFQNQMNNFGSRNEKIEVQVRHLYFSWRKEREVKQIAL